MRGKLPNMWQIERLGIFCAIKDTITGTKKRYYLHKQPYPRFYSR